MLIKARQKASNSNSTATAAAAGYRTHFQNFAMGTVSGALDAANSLFAGFFGQAANLGEQARSATWEKAHDDAFTKAMQELKPDFDQCPRCSTWVCRKKCWNDERGLCKNCAPDLGVEMSAAKASRTVEEVWAQSKVAEEDRQMLTEESWRAGVRATCPNCEAPLEPNAKFCPEWGTKIEVARFCEGCGTPLARRCPACGEEAASGARFCGSCGTALTAGPAAAPPPASLQHPHAQLGFPPWPTS